MVLWTSCSTATGCRARARRSGVDEDLLLLPELPHEPARKKPERDDRDEQEQGENRSQADPADWLR